jgi:hypothetical protein
MFDLISAAWLCGPGDTETILGRLDVQSQVTQEIRNEKIRIEN